MLMARRRRTGLSAWLMLLVAAILIAPALLSGASLDPVFEHPVSVKRMAAVLASTTDTLKSAAAVQGGFEQQVFLQGLPKPLQSTGRFLVARGLGVDWHTLTPFDAEILLTSAALIQRSGNGKTQTLISGQRAGLAAVERSFNAMFTLNLDQLAQRFSLYGTQQAGGWTLGLKPRGKALAAQLQAVVLVGAKQPQQVTLYKPNGDRTQICFHDVVVESSLSDAQRQLFHH